MTSLHKLRRSRGVSLSQLAARTAIPMRQLAAFEYHEQPLSPAEEQRVADVFAVPTSMLHTDDWLSRGRPATPSADTRTLPFPIQLLLGMILLLYIGRLMVLPFFAVYFSATLHFNGWQVASLLTVMLLCQRAFPLVGGLVGDRMSHVRVVIVGLLGTGAGVASFGLFQEFWWLVGGAVLFGAAGALIDPSINAILAAASPPQRPLIFMRYNQMMNLATMSGPIAGSYLLTRGPMLLFSTSGALFIGIAAALFAGRHYYPTTLEHETVQYSLRQVWQIKGFIKFLVIMILFWIMFAQLTVALPLHAFRLGQTEQAVSVLFFVNGLAGILLIAGLQTVFRTVHSLKLLRIGVLCVGLGLSLIPIFSSMTWLLVCVVVYTIGETLVLPSADIAVADFSANRYTGTFYGLFEVSWAVGGTLGNYVGTWTISYPNGAVWPWLIYGCLGLLTCVLLRYCYEGEINAGSRSHPV